MRRISVLTAALAAALAAAAPATAQQRGEAQLQVGGKAVKQLDRAGVRIRAGRPALGRSRVMLPVARAEVGPTAAIRLRGTLQLRRKGRGVSLRGLRLAIGPRSATLSAVVGGKRAPALSGRFPARRLALDRDTGRVLLTATTMKLSRPLARRLSARLNLRAAPSGAFGRLAVGIPAGGGTPTGGSAPGGGTGPAGPGGSGPGGAPGSPGGGSSPSEPVPLARPSTAVDVTSAAVNWHVRDSFIEYINSGEGTSVSGGATAGPAKQRCNGQELYDYDFQFPFARGWYDPSSGTAAISFGGAVRFRYSAHGIDILTSDPEIEINGPSSRSIFRVEDSDGNRRGVMTEFKQPGTVAAAEPCHDDPGPTGSANPQVAGTTYTYERMPGTVPDSAAAGVFAGFYPANAPFGWLTLTFTTP